MSPRRHWLPMLSALALLVSSFALAPQPMEAQGEAVTYTVTTVLDNLSGNCTATPNTCSLRQAINSASADGTTSLIQFSVGSGTQTIVLTSEIPPLGGTGDRISGAVDNFGRPRVVISGGNNPDIPAGLQITGSNNTIEKLIFNNFVTTTAPNGVGIWITGPGATGNKIYGNYFGIQPGDTTSYPNQRGIQIDNGASGNIVGGAASEPTQRNIIAGNNLSGIYLSGANGNFIRGNFIGMALDANGAVVALGNGGPGIELTNSGGNEVGGAAEQRNLIADNSIGILINGTAATGNQIRSNYIGTDDNALVALGTQERGVMIQGGAKNNVLSGSSAAQLIISGNTGYGVLLRGAGTTGNTIAGAYIGTGFNSTTAVPNGLGGVRIEDSANRNTVGPNAVISGNTGDGVSIGLTLPTATTVVSNSIQASLIGLNRDGTAPLPNTGRGIAVNDGASETLIGGNSSADANYIAANGGPAIQISGVTNELTVVRNNVIGVRRAVPGGSFTARAPNVGAGVLVSDGARQVTIASNTVAADADNTATDFPGIHVVGDGTAGNDGPFSLSSTNVATVTISSNRIGWLPTSPSNATPAPFPNGDGIAVSGRIQALNVLSNTIQLNQGLAIRLSDVLTATVRGQNPVARNRDGGIRIDGASFNLTVERNIVRENGRSANGAAVLNPSADAIALVAAPSSVITGANVISNSITANTGRGLVLEGDVNRATLRYNYLTGNGGPIDLVGATTYPGSGADPDSQATPNHGIDAPIVDLSFVNPLSLRVNQAGFIEGYVYTSTVRTETGLAPVSACITCTIQLFAVAPPPAAADGQGATLLRSIPEFGGGSTPRDFISVAPNGRFSARIVDPLPRQILLVATDGFGNSSEYAVLPVTGSIVLEGVTPLAASAAPGDTVTYTLRLRNTGTVGYTSLRLRTSGTLERWIVGTAPLTTTEFALAAGAERLVTVTLKLPTGPDPNVVAGKVDTTTVQITGAPPAVTATAQLVTTVLPRPVIRVTPRSSLGSGKPGTTVPHAFTLRNDGNVTVTLNLAYTTVDAATSPGIWPTSLTTSTLTLPPGRDARTLLSVTVPTAAIQGASATTYLTATVQPGVAPGPVFPGVTEYFSATTRADLNDNADLYPNQTGQGAAGGEVSLTHTVENKSNGVAKFCLDYVAASQSTVRFVSATNNFVIDSQGCFTLYTAANSAQGQFTQAQFRAIITLDQRLLRDDTEQVTIFLRKGSPTGETISDAVVEDTIQITAGFKLPRLWAPLVRR
jgi:CSLREA domain-containing protein